MMHELTPGKQCVYRERVVEIDGPLSSSRLSVRDVISGELLDAAVGDLQPTRSRGKSSIVDSRFVPARQWDAAANLARTFGSWPEGAHLMAEEAARLAKEQGVCVRTIERRFRSFRRQGRASDLVPGRGGRRTGTRLCSSDIEAVISECIELHFLNRQRPTVAYLVEQVAAACRERQLTPPARSTITRRVDAISAYDRERRRRGSVAAKQQFAPRPGYLKADRPLAIVEIDHTRCDVMLVAENDRRSLLGRPWVTLAIDVCTRCVVGIHVTFDAPSATSVALCLEQAVLPKEAWLAELGIDAKWPMYGRPETLLLDNGAEFHGQALQRGCDDFGINVQYRPVKQPHYGAHIERLNGTLMLRAHLVPGTTFSNPKERGTYDSAKRAVMTLREFRAWLIEQITFWYHVKPHRGLDGRAPLQAWESAWREGTTIRVPPVIAAPLDLRAAFLPIAWRQVQRTGISLWGLRYWHESLAPQIASTEPVCVRYDPRNISYVLVRTADEQLIEVPVASPDVQAISLAEHKMRLRDARKEGMSPELLALQDEGARRTAQSLRSAAEQKRATRRERAAAEQRHVEARPEPKAAKPCEMDALLEPCIVPAHEFSTQFIATAEIWHSDYSQGGL